MRVSLATGPPFPPQQVREEKSRRTGQAAISVRVRLAREITLPDVQSRGRDSGGLSTLLHRRH